MISDMSREDGGAGDVDYGAFGRGYSRFRRPDPRIAATIVAALGDARTVLNIGAGAGSYEPPDREITAVEPSRSMRDQRPPHLARAIDAVADDLPFPDRCFDAAMATFTVHQWQDLASGLREMRRVTRGPAVILTCDPRLVRNFWLDRYAPLVLATEARRYPAPELIGARLGKNFEVIPVPIPLDCHDGFNEAYYGRPERLLDAEARGACSAWSFVDAKTASKYVEALRHSLECGEWDRDFGFLRTQPHYEGSLRMIVSYPR